MANTKTESFLEPEPLALVNASSWLRPSRDYRSRSICL